MAAHASLAAMSHSMILAAALALAAGAAHASGKPAADKPADRAVDVSAVGMPVVWRGRVVNYVFVVTRLKLAPGQDLEKLRTREPFLRDALVRAAHRTPFVDPRDLTRVDERAVTAALMRAGAAVAGPRAFASAEVVSQQPRQRSGLPRLGPEPQAGRAITP